MLDSSALNPVCGSQEPTTPWPSELTDHIRRVQGQSEGDDTAALTRASSDEDKHAQSQTKLQLRDTLKPLLHRPRNSAGLEGTRPPS